MNKEVLLLSVASLLISCGGSSNSDESQSDYYLGNWKSGCEHWEDTIGGSVLVIAAGETHLGGFENVFLKEILRIDEDGVEIDWEVYEESSCNNVHEDSLSIVNSALDMSYSKSNVNYESNVDVDGYPVRSYFLESDFFTIPVSINLHLTNDTLYRVSPDGLIVDDEQEFTIDFNYMFNRTN